MEEDKVSYLILYVPSREIQFDNLTNLISSSEINTTLKQMKQNTTQTHFV